MAIKNSFPNINDDIEAIAYRIAAVRGEDTDDSSVRDRVVSNFIREGGTLSPDDRRLFDYLATSNVEALTRDVNTMINFLQEQKREGIFPILNGNSEVTKRVRLIAQEILRRKGIRI